MLTDKLLAEIENGDGVRLAVAARKLPSNRQGKAVTMSCLLRWVLDGLRLPSAERVYLEAARVAGKWVTTPQAIRRFIEAQNLTSTGATPTPSPGAAVARLAKRAENAGKKLEKMGA